MDMEPANEETSSFLRKSLLYKELREEHEEVLRHKWLESEKAGHDIGFEQALIDWIVKYRSVWRAKKKKHPDEDERG